MASVNAFFVIVDMMIAALCKRSARAANHRPGQNAFSPRHHMIHSNMQFDMTGKTLVLCYPNRHISICKQGFQLILRHVDMSKSGVRPGIGSVEDHDLIS